MTTSIFAAGPHAGSNCSIMRQQKSSKMKVMPAAKSIVGSRPRHWSKSDSAASSASLSQRLTKTSSKSNRKIQLAKVVCSSVPIINSRKHAFGMPHPSIRQRSAAGDEGNPIVARDVVGGTFVTPQRRKGCIPKQFEPAALTRSLSDVRARPCRWAADDMSVIADDFDNDSGVGRESVSQTAQIPLPNEGHSIVNAPAQRESQVLSPQKVDPRDPPAMAGVHKASQSKAKLGRFGKRLKYLRDNLKGDCLRFQSGQYPFAAKSNRIGGYNGDSGDPRSRASSYCDMTIMGPLIPFGNGNDGNLVAALAYVHCFQQKEMAIAVSEQSPTNVANKQEFVWVLFCHKTVVEQNIAIQSQLRIYNSIWIPHLELERHSNAASASYLQAIGVEAAVTWLVACTVLCEPYPSEILPTLQHICELDKLDWTLKDADG